MSDIEDDSHQRIGQEYARSLEAVQDILNDWGLSVSRDGAATFLARLANKGYILVEHETYDLVRKTDG